MRKIFLFFAFAGFCFGVEEFLGNLGTIVVTEEKPIWQVSSYVDVITQEEIQNSNADSITDILREKTSINVSDWMGNSAKVNVDLMGFGETSPSNVLVLLDGKRINEIDLSGPDWLSIPLSRIKCIEIIKGGNSALYGDNAGGGIINIITEAPVEKKISVTSKAGSFNSIENRFSLMNRVKNFSYELEGSLISTEGFREENSFKRGDFSGNLTYERDIKLKLSHFFHKDNYEMPGGMWENDFKENPRKGTSGNDSETLSSFSEVSFEKKLDTFDLSTDFSYRAKNLKTTYGTFSYDSEIPQIFFRQKVKIKKQIFGRKNILAFNLEKFLVNFKQDSFSSGIFTRFTEISKRANAFSLGNEFFITQNLVFNISARKEFFDFDFKTSTPSATELTDTRKDTVDAFSAGISLNLNERTNFYLSFSRNFRIPNVDEFKTFDPITYAPTGINKDLKPQKSSEYQTGIRKTFENLSFSFGLYRKVVRDEIFYNSLTYANENYPRTLHQGINFSSKLNFTPFSAGFNYSYLNSCLLENKGAIQKGNIIPGVPKNRFNLNINLALLKNLTFQTTANYTGEKFFISDWKNEGKKMPEIFVIDFNFSFKKNALKISGGIKNLFNRKYAEYGTYSFNWSLWNYDYYYYPCPERSFHGGISLEF